MQMTLREVVTMSRCHEATGRAQKKSFVAVIVVVAASFATRRTKSLRVDATNSLHSERVDMTTDTKDGGRGANESSSPKKHEVHRRVFDVALTLQQMSDRMLSSNGTWMETHGRWDWLDHHNGGYRWSSSLLGTNESSINRTKIFPNVTSIAMYGSSYTRELLLEMERLHFNISKRATCNNKQWNPQRPECHTSEEWEVIASNEPIQLNSDCIPFHKQFSLGSRSSCSTAPCNANFWPPQREGIDLITCGPPGFRVVHTTSSSDDRTRGPPSVVIGFKTFIHTPPLENLFLQRLASANLTDVDVAIVEMGYPWGARGRRSDDDGRLLPNMTQQEEIQYYVDWVHEVAFPDVLVVWVATCGCDGKVDLEVGIEETLTLVRRQPLAIVLDKRYLCHTKPRKMPSGHGCSGPVLTVLGRMLGVLLEHVGKRSALRGS